MRRTLVVAVSAALFAVGFVAAGCSSHAKGDRLTSFTAPVTDTSDQAGSVTGGTPRQRRALAEALARLHSHGTRVEIAPGPRAGYTGHRTTLTFIGPSDPESQWKDEVALGVYLARGFPARWVVIPGTGAGHYVLRHGMEAAGKAQFLRTLRRAARRSHAKIDRVEFLEPSALAPVVTIAALRPSVLERKGLPLGSLDDGSHLRLEGVFLIVHGPWGQVTTRGGTAFRVGAGAGRWPGPIQNNGISGRP